MLVVAALLFPAFLLLVLVLMERVEAPLRHEAVGEHVAAFLDTARPEELEAFVREGLETTLDRYWRRHTRSRLRAPLRAPLRVPTRAQPPSLRETARTG